MDSRRQPVNRPRIARLPAGLRRIGQPPGYNVVERWINRLKQWRGLATRYEKRAVSERAMVVLASIVLWSES